MEHKSFTFELGNRDLTPEEVGVVQKARDSFAASAKRHGVHIQGGVLIKIVSGGSATGAVNRPKGTDIVRSDGSPNIGTERAREAGTPIATLKR